MGIFLDGIITKKNAKIERDRYVKRYFEILKMRQYQLKDLAFMQTPYTDLMSFQANYVYHKRKMEKQGFKIENKYKVYDNLMNSYLQNTAGFAWFGSLVTRDNIGSYFQKEFPAQMKNYFERIVFSFSIFPAFKASGFESPNIR